MTIPDLFLLFRRLTDFFVERHLIKSTEEQHRAQILAACILLILCCSLLTSAGLLLASLQNPDLRLGAVITLVNSIFYLLCLLILKVSGRTLWAAHGFAASVYLVLMLAGYISGGPIATSAQILVLLPFIMFFTTGTTGGLIWSAIILFSQVSIYLAYWSGMDFIQTMNESTRITQSLVHWLITLLGIVTISWVYEVSNQRLSIQKHLREIDNRFLLHHDLLTGLSNRQAFENRLEESARLAGRQKSSLLLVLADIRDFHKINSRYGYATGDDILREFSSRLKYATGLYIARTAGNQFALIIPADVDNSSAEQIAGKLLGHLTEPFSIKHTIISLKICLGISRFSPDKNAENLFLQAEQALQQARLSPQCFAVSAC